MNMETSEKKHIVLARKYRPKMLAELIGQDVFVKTISNAITTNKLHHAFLLTGTRGVGKTSSARILALSLNCKKFDAPTLTPCLECECCKAILNGSNPDVIEFDAASNTGKDDIHEVVLDKIAYAPMMSRYRVYIIDEVHMLSKSAFNAFLKTLEEPPEKVKFIFATTEVNKVPITIMSRCQKFYLKNVSADVIFPHLKKICEQEEIKYDEESLKLIAKYANGSVRDGLSLLDQAISICDSKISFQDVEKMLAIPDKQMLAELFYSVYLGDVKDALEKADCFISNEVETFSVVNEIMEIILDWLRVASGVIAIEKVGVETAGILIKLIDDNNLNVPRLLRMWQVVSNSLGEIKSIQSRQYLTILIYKLCYISTLPTPVEILKTIKDEDLKQVSLIFPEAKVVK